MLAQALVAEVAKITRNHEVAGVTVGLLVRLCAGGLNRLLSVKHGGKVRSHCRGDPHGRTGCPRELKARAATNHLKQGNYILDSRNAFG